MISYIIIDDEPVAHEIIRDYCDLLPNLKLAGHCYDALEAVELLRKKTVDLIFLDLNMPKLKGFEFLRTLPQPPRIIVTTAYKEFALEGYELNVVDYLLKPFEFSRFVKAVNKVTSQPAPSVRVSESVSDDRSIFVRSDKKHVQVRIREILYIEASGNYVKIITKVGATLIRGKLSELVETINSKDLIRVHRSFVVARSHIDLIEGNRIKISGHIIPVGKTYKVNVDHLL